LNKHLASDAKRDENVGRGRAYKQLGGMGSSGAGVVFAAWKLK